jgi:DNA-directed RNA polymerase specialized sigma24 family protein
MSDAQNTNVAGERFTTTHWSVVLAAGETANPTAEVALEKLCRNYWYPLYAFARRSGQSEENAKDLTQSFFARLLREKYVRQAQRERGRFRNFLLTYFKHFAADEWDRETALKRGGGCEILSFDAETAEKRYHLEPVDEVTPDKLFDRRWAFATLEEAARLLRKEYQDAGRGDLFDKLQAFLSGDLEDAGYSEAAAKLSMSENTLKSHVRRLRLRNREILREVIANTVASPDQIDEELRDLSAALAAV